MTVLRNVYYVHDDGSAVLKCGDASVLIDADSVDRLSSYQWSIGTHGYATHGAGSDQVLMHRLISGAYETDFVDHINRDKLDNRKCNLRICTMRQNSMNRTKQINNHSGYKGVCQTVTGKWQAQIQYKGKAIYLGLFDDPETAAKAYDTAARDIFGEYAFLNFPDINEQVTADFNRRRKLTLQEVESVRFLYSQGVSVHSLTKLFCHSDSAIRRIISGHTFCKGELQ